MRSELVFKKFFCNGLRESDSEKYFAGDVDGSVEAILEVFATYSSTKCTLDIIGWGVGPLTDSELELAKTFNGE